MSLKIDQDHSRFRAIVRGKIRDNLRKYISHGELMGRKGKDLVTIPLPQIDIPHFRYGDKQQGGAGQGEGDVGDSMGGGEGDQPGDGKQAGKDAGARVAELQLRMLGVPAAKAKKAAWRKINPLTLRASAALAGLAREAK